MEKSTNYCFSEELYENMCKEEKDKISLDFLYNAVCCFHDVPDDKIVEMLMALGDEEFATLEKSLRETRNAVRKMQSAVCKDGDLDAVYSSPDIEDILFYQISNGLPIS